MSTRHRNEIVTALATKLCAGTTNVRDTRCVTRLDATATASISRMHHRSNVDRVAVTHLDNPGVTALHEGVNGEVVHAVLPDDLGGGLMGLERIQEHERHVCSPDEISTKFQRAHNGQQTAAAAATATTIQAVSGQWPIRPRQGRAGARGRWGWGRGGFSYVPECGVWSGFRLTSVPEAAANRCTRTIAP